MYKEENIELYSKFFCLLVFSLVIILLDNVYSLLLLFLYFFLMDKYYKNYVSLLLYSLTLLGLAFAFSDNGLWCLKLMLTGDYIYYFFHSFKVNKHSGLFHRESVIVNVKDVSVDQNIKIQSNLIDHELSKGQALKQDKRDMIRNNLSSKVDGMRKKVRLFEYFRFKKQNKSTKLLFSWQLDGNNSYYLLFHLLLLCIAIVVE